MAEISVKVVVDFKEPMAVGEFQDAIVLTEEEYAAITEEELNARVQERIDAHVELINNPPPPIVLTDEEKAEWAAKLGLPDPEIADNG